MTESPDEDAARSRQTLIGAIVVVVLLVLGWWVMSEMQRHRQIEDCVASGRRDCIPIELK